MSIHSFSYGLIEGFYGRSWRWEERSANASFLTEYQYDFYIYAPKTDRYLREKWDEDWPEDELVKLRSFSGLVKDNNLRFGVGLSPFEIYHHFDNTAKDALHHKLLLINDLQPDILSLLFDDMKGDNRMLARVQADVFAFVTGISKANHFIVCPTYYSFDPVLEKIFGKMPDRYLEDLGELLDPSVDIFWTGPMVCSSGYDRHHLEQVAELIKRKPFIWDNYPVNDSPRMSPFLHLRPFTNRSHQLSEWCAGHAVNPMNQAYLSQIPLKTLSLSYQKKDQYAPESALIDAAITLCGEDLGECLIEDIEIFQDIGLNGLNMDDKNTLIKKYSRFNSPYASEIVQWLKGEYEEN